MGSHGSFAYDDQTSNRLIDTVFVNQPIGIYLLHIVFEKMNSIPSKMDVVSGNFEDPIHLVRHSKSSIKMINNLFK